MDLPEFLRSNLVIFNLGLERSSLAVLCIFQESLKAIAGTSERSKGKTTPILSIDFESLVPVSYGCSAFRSEARLTVFLFFLLEFLCGIKHSISERRSEKQFFGGQH